MRVTFFAPFDHVEQPYVPLYKGALERQGLAVQLDGAFTLKWLLTKGKSCDAIHLHGIEQTYKPKRSNIRSELVKKLLDNHWIRPLRGALRLVCCSVAFLLAKLQGKVIVYTVHDLKPHHKEPWPFAIVRRMAHRVVFSLVDRIHAHNHYSRQLLETIYKRQDGICVIPIGNYIGYYLNEISQLEARRQLNLPEDAFVYLFLGIIRPHKGVDDLIAAFEKLDLPDSRLLIVGRISTSIHKTIVNLTRDKPTIKLIPEFVPDMTIQLYMNACNICVLPYKYVTTSSAVMLAWTFGRPVIVPAVGCFPESVTPETGILYHPSQPNALVSALQQARGHSWSESRILDYVHQFDWDKLGPQLANLYQAEPDRFSIEHFLTIF